MPTLQERFDAKHVPEPNSGCWLWLAVIVRRGYGQIRVKGRMRYAHRVSYELHRGPIPAGLTLDHLCRVPCCVNPDHMEPITMRENIRRGPQGRLGGERMRAKTHCPAGHAYEGRNLYIAPKGDRRCRACERARIRV